MFPPLRIPPPPPPPREGPEYGVQYATGQDGGTRDADGPTRWGTVLWAFGSSRAAAAYVLGKPLTGPTGVCATGPAAASVWTRVVRRGLATCQVGPPIPPRRSHVMRVAWLPPRPVPEARAAVPA